jgi:hypothetical protein
MLRRAAVEYHRIDLGSGDQGGQVIVLKPGDQHGKAERVEAAFGQHQVVL